MEPLKIEISIGLKDETIEAVKQLLLASIASFMELAKNTTPAAPTEEKTDDPAPAAEVKAEEPAPAVDDMPDFEEVSDSALAEATRAAVVRLRAAGTSPTVIRTEVFAKYGISQSTDCPKERRAEFLNDINSLCND